MLCQLLEEKILLQLFGMIKFSNPSYLVGLHTLGKSKDKRKKKSVGGPLQKKKIQ